MKRIQIRFISLISEKFFKRNGLTLPAAEAPFQQVFNTLWLRLHWNVNYLNPAPGFTSSWIIFIVLKINLYFHNMHWWFKKFIEHLLMYSKIYLLLWDYCTIVQLIILLYCIVLTIPEKHLSNILQRLYSGYFGPENAHRKPSVILTIVPVAGYYIYSQRDIYSTLEKIDQ